MPDSRDPRAAFIFEGIGDEELIGDHPSLQVRWGAAGYEFDRYEAELGSPPNTLLLASSIGFKTQYATPLIDEELWFAGGRDGARVSDPAARRRAAPLRAGRYYLHGLSEGRRGLRRRIDLLARRAVVEQLRQHGLEGYRECSSGDSPGTAGRRPRRVAHSSMFSVIPR